MFGKKGKGEVKVLAPDSGIAIFWKNIDIYIGQTLWISDNIDNFY